jgi:hypothetical protein
MWDKLQSRHNDYNYLNKPAIKRCLENFPLKQIIFNWIALDIDLKATGELADFKSMLKEKYLSQYSFETDVWVIATVAVQTKYYRPYFLNYRLVASSINLFITPTYHS